jgi:hypothetical protein
MEFLFKWDGKEYVVEGTQNSLEHLVLSDTREVLTISEWSDEPTPRIDYLMKVLHDYQESLAEELSLIFNAPIAKLTEPIKTELEELEGE